MAVVVTVGGIAVLGTVTATLASYLVERVQEVEEESQSANRADVRALTAEVAALRDEVSEQRGSHARSLDP